MEYFMGDSGIVEERFNDEFPHYRARYPGTSTRNWRDVFAADKMAKEMKNSILSGAKSGRQYYINGARHTASAPGQSPANQSGDLVKSIKVSKERNKSIISISKNYAVYLEFGTSKMRPRPFIIPAFMKTKQWIINKLKGISK
jgi:HK97 gp10 family phage protein